MLHFSDVLTDSQYKFVVERTTKSKSWLFEAGSDPKFIGSWRLDLDEEPFFSQTCLETIEKFSVKKFRLDRVYATGRTFGQCGDFYQGYTQSSNHTFIYYVNPEWDITWGGETVFRTPNGLLAMTPHPNSGILFDNNILHFERDPSRHFGGLRVSITFKLTEIV
jgi:SM-20-related protein